MACGGGSGNGGGGGGGAVLPFLPPPTGSAEPPRTTARRPVPEGPPPLTVAKGFCTEGGTPESALQGQVPAAMRQGFKGFSCNLQLVGQFEGEGGNWSAASFRDPGGAHLRLSRDRLSGVLRRPTARAREPRVPVIDITDPRPSPGAACPSPRPRCWTRGNRCCVNARRQLLLADNGNNGSIVPGFGGAELDIYDLSGDCRTPQLLASMEVGTGKTAASCPPRVRKGTKAMCRPTG